MAREIEVYFTPASPWTFLGWDRLGALIAREGVEARWYPVDYGVVFPRTGGLPLPQRAPERQRYRLMELKRWSRRLHVPLHLEPRHFPVADGDAALSILAARERGLDVWSLARAFMAAVWQQQRDIADPATRRAILEENGLDADALERHAAGLAALRAEESERAVARGVFGAPTVIFEDELFWGQDRLDFLEEAIVARGG
jgi:2-hydroxychromene-2-carboxylate isomerase